ncbi:MAG TPA: type I polyketide synthase [Clostridia bacterium]
MEKLIDINYLKVSDAKKDYKFKEISKKDIAVIGAAGRFGCAEDIGTLWSLFREGKDFVRSMPENRIKDNEAYINALDTAGSNNENIRYIEAAYMDRIDTFDCGVFNIPPKEADLMDPNQRQMIEVIWECIEDSGYGGKKLRGSRTGIFLGFSSDFGEEYKRYLSVVSDNNEEVSVTGNIKSIIASRISYILDLKGPSIMIDTACSSSLVSVHMACQAIRNGECDMALAGGVKLLIVAPLDDSRQGSIGILSPGARARTFDDRSDGTGLGEGAGAVLLKPLSKAVEDGDHIYAVIKGSAVNQDGNSIGITAPNMAAQEDVIVRAWRDANIEPETISYIETHGTATKLGDPIEITGIKRAFENFTDKKQFCAVASVKSNIGHLDHTAGIAALLKAVMSIKHGELPPSIHFQKPNRKISFEDSPVYVNDKLVKWESSTPKRCGISSFGLSGTNCHIVLEEYKASEKCKSKEPNLTGPGILTLSANNKESLMALLKRYDSYLEACDENDFLNICYTANTGREHYNLRLALIADSIKDLRDKIKNLINNGIESANQTEVFLGEHKVIASTKRTRFDGDITEDEKRQLSSESASVINTILKGLDLKEYFNNLKILASLYIKGADIEWDNLYSQLKYYRLSIPVYPFAKERHWIEQKKEAAGSTDKYKAEKMKNSLLDLCLAESMDIKIYSTHFSVEKHWVLNEHKVAGSYVVPGTTYIEMICEIISRDNPQHTVEMKDILFFTPLTVENGSEVEVHTIVKDEGEYKSFSVAAKSTADGSWIKHVEGKYRVVEDCNAVNFDINEYKHDFKMVDNLQYGEDNGYAVKIGPRFKNLIEVYTGNDEVLAHLRLPKEYIDEAASFRMHPALMDTAVNMANGTIGEGFYLPLNYRSLRIYGRMPGEFYCHLKRKNKDKHNDETGVWDILLIEETGKVFAELEGYTVKKVHHEEVKSVKSYNADLGFYETGWIERKLPDRINNLKKGAALVFKDKSAVSSKLVQRLDEIGFEIYEVEMGNNFEMLDVNKFIISGSEDDYSKVIKSIPTRISHAIHLMSANNSDEINTCAELNEINRKGIHSIFYLTKALVKSKLNPIDLILISNNSFEVSGKETRINPQGPAVFALGRVAEKEHVGLKCKCIDIDDSVAIDDIVNEISITDELPIAAYRNRKRYIEEFKKVDINAREKIKTDIKSEGIYIITGGAGGIGLEIAKYLSSRNKVNLCFINRSRIPDRDEWENILKVNDDIKLSKKINAIREIEESGSKVVFYSADVSDIDIMGDIFSELKSAYGRINGVIHAAGVAGDGYIIRKPDNVFNQVILPKINGTWVLDKLTENDEIDFLALFSSISCFTFNPGQSDYTAANAYMDSYACKRNIMGRRTFAINWPAWKETGMAVDLKALNNESLFRPISTFDALGAFEVLLEHQIARAIPSELNYKIFEMKDINIPYVLSDEIRLKSERNSRNTMNSAVQKVSEQKIDKVVLKGKQGKAYSETERFLGELWSKVLGVTEIDIYDSFNDLGGDSILSTKLLKEMQKKYGDIVDISDLFTYSCINDMSEYIDGKTGKKKEFEKISVDDDCTEDMLEDVLKQLASGEISLEAANELIDMGVNE